MLINLPKERKLQEKQWLAASISELFGTKNESVINFLINETDWISIDSGDVLFNQGDEGDGLFFVIQGRLGVWGKDQSGQRLKIADIGRGETIGEMALFTGEPRNADVIANRKTILAKLTNRAYRNFAIQFPDLNFDIFRLVIQRLSLRKLEKGSNRPVTICLVALNDIDTASLYTSLHQALSLMSEVNWVDFDFYKKHTSEANSGFQPDHFSDFLLDLELNSSLLVLDAGGGNEQFQKICVSHADVVLLLSDASKASNVGALEQSIAESSAAEKCFVFVHPEHCRLPEGTAQKLEIRNYVGRHFHVRIQNKSDIGRLARLITGHGTGLVLAGGGAKGFAHMGVFKALKENGFSFDFIGGTSIGAMNAAAIAFDASVDDTIRFMKKAALYHPTKDFNLLPLVSLIRGKRLEHLVKTAIFDFSGRNDVDLTDLWIPLFVVSSNYSKARQEIHLRGSLLQHLLASAAIPGIFPPVVKENDLLLDGGSFNNFPIDVMHREGIERIIGSDFVVEKNYELKFDKVPGPWKLLYHKWVYGRRNIYRVPSLVSIMLNTTLLYSNAKRKESLRMTDLHFNPPVEKLGFTDWKRFDQFVEAGYRHAKEKLSTLTPEEMNSWKKYRKQ